VIRGHCFPVIAFTSGNSSETDKRLTVEVLLPGKRAAPASIAKYLYSINAPAIT